MLYLKTILYRFSVTALMQTIERTYILQKESSEKCRKNARIVPKTYYCRGAMREYERRDQMDS
jgi:hypothetical protein